MGAPVAPRDGVPTGAGARTGAVSTVGLERRGAGRGDGEAARGTEGQQREQVVIIDLPDRRAGLVVDELTGQQEIVVKQYDGVKQGLTLFGGATILGDGAPALIVDVSSLP